MIFKNPLNRDDNNYTLNFSLEENGSLTLISNAQAGLKSPVALTFERRAADKLAIVLKDGDQSYELQDSFTGLSAAGEISVQVDVHEHGHIVMWIGSEEDEWAFTSEVNGTFWGLKLSSAVVNSVKLDQAKEVH